MLKAKTDFCSSKLHQIGLEQSEDYAQTVENPDLWHPTKAFEVVVEYGIRPSIRPSMISSPDKTRLTPSLLPLHSFLVRALPMRNWGSPYYPSFAVQPYSQRIRSGRQWQRTAAGLVATLAHPRLLSLSRDHIPAHLPDTIRYFEYVPFSQVLPRTAALAYHTTTAVVEKSNHLLGETAVRSRCQELAGRMDFDASLAQACDVIEQVRRTPDTERGGD